MLPRQSTSQTIPRLALARVCGTEDEGEQQKFIDGIEAGQVFVNGVVACNSANPLRRRQAVRLRKKWNYQASGNS